MLKFDRLIHDAALIYARVTLPFDQRVISRQKVELDNGEAAGLFLPRGTILHEGQLIGAPGGQVIEVHAANEAVSTVRVDDALALARACYHLGNRHVALQIGAGFIRYQHDHVLDDLVRGLGLEVTGEHAAFEPEAGAYGGGHRHADHEHSHAQ